MFQSQNYSAMRYISLRSRIMIMLILISGSAAFITIIIGYQSGKEAITQGILNQLTGIKASKKNQIENYLDQMSGIVETLGHNDMIVDAMKDFKRGFSRINRKELEINCHSALTDFYHQYVDRLSTNLDIKPDIDLYYPNSTAACQLQYEYIVDSDYPIGQKHLMLNANDGSYYSQVHEKYHQYMTDVILRFGFYDIFLVDLIKGDIVYTSYKEADFATNLYSGPYRESNLAHLVRSLKENNDIREAQIIDYRTYRPSYGAPAAFIGVPMTENGEVIGALVLQLPVATIDNIMTGNQNWLHDGLGESGETYLVGEDLMMRSISRFYLEDTTGYKDALRSIGVPSEEIEKTYRLGTTILNQRVRTDGVFDALNGNENTRIIDDYRGVPVLSSYAPLRFKNLKWAILSEIDVAEANKPIKQFQRKIFITLFLIVLLTTFLSMYLANLFVRPVERLSKAVLDLNAGDYTKRIETRGTDEFAVLSESFNEMAASLENQNNQIHKQSTENENLLLNFIPPSLAHRLRSGENDISEKYSNVSLITIDVVGFSALTGQRSAEESIRLLNHLINVIDSIANKYQIEKIRTVGDTYFAGCGLFNPRLDHCKRTLDFGIEVSQIIAQFNINHALDLKLEMAIHTGEMIGGIVGNEKFNFDLFGSTVSYLFKMKELTGDHTIIVSHSVKEKMDDMYSFEKSGELYGHDIWSVNHENKSLL